MITLRAAEWVSSDGRHAAHLDADAAGRNVKDYHQMTSRWEWEANSHTTRTGNVILEFDTPEAETLFRLRYL